MSQESTKPLAPIDITVVRHGETLQNVLGVLQGHYEGELNDLGRQQAMAAGNALHGQTFDACYASDLKRTLESAEIILKTAEIKMDVIPEYGLREWH